MLVKRIVYLTLLQLVLFAAKAQCPQVLDYLNNPSSHPYWIHCAGGTYTLNFQSPGAWGSYTISWGDATPDQTGASYTSNSIIPHQYPATIDTFVVTLMIPSLSCTMTGVVVTEMPVSSLLSIPVGGTLAGCSPASLTFSNTSTNVSQTTHFNYKWGDNTPDSYFTYTNTSANHVYSAANVTCATQATLEAWNYCSFTSTSTAIIGPVNVYAKDIPVITSSVTNRCWPDNVFTFTNTSTQNCTAFGNNYQRKQYWKLGNYWAFNSFQDSIYPWTNIPPNTPVTVAYPNLGGYFIWLKDSSVCGQDSVSQLVNIFNAPTASMVAPAGPFCTSSLMTFTNASSVGVFYKWDMGDGSGFINFPFGPKTYSYATANTYTVRLVAYIPFGGMCSDTDQVVITVLPGPTCTFACAPTQSCNSLMGVNFVDNTPPPVTSWNWNFGNTNTSTLQNPPAQNYTVAGTHVITLTITAPNGCQSTDSHTVQVDSPPTGSFVSSQVCVGSVTSFTNLTPAAISFTWNFGDASAPSNVVNPTHTYPAAGVYTVTLTSSNGVCAGTYTNTAFVIALPIPSFVITPTAGCAPFFVTCTNQSTAAASYVWNFGDSSPTSTVGNPVHTYASPTTANQTYTITLIANNASGCGDSIKKTVTLYGNPLPSFTFAPKAGCSPFAVTFNNTSVGGTSNLWSLSTQTSSATSPSQTFTNAPGSPSVTLPVKLVVTNANGCKDSITDFVTLFAKPLADILVDSAVCHPKIVTFTNTSVGATTYSWNFGSSSSSTVLIPSVTFTNPGATPQNSVTQLTVANSDGCTHSFTVNTVIYPKPNLVYTAAPDSGCSPLIVNFPAVTGYTAYSWNLGNSNSATTSSANTTYLNITGVPKTYTATLIVTDIHGCKDTTAKTVKSFPSPVASFSALGSLTVNVPNSTIQFTNNSMGATIYSWGFGDGDVSNVQHPAHTYSVPGTYRAWLTVKNSSGCKDSTRMSETIIVEGQSYFAMPNAFTPNQTQSPGAIYDPKDLSNDVFHPHMEGITKIKFTVYSRWGEVIFDTEDIAQGWDGYYKGKLCDQGVYVWRVRAEAYDGTVYDKAGDVTLIR